MAGPVVFEETTEFKKSIIVPAGSVIMGPDGAVISSAARSFLYTDARERETLFTQYSFDNSGTTNAYQWTSPGVSSQLDVCPDSGNTLSDPQELAFSGAAADTLSIAFWVIPKTTGTLRIQAWEGVDDTGAVLSDTLFEITAPQIDVNIQLMLSPAQISEVGDMQFVRFSGIQLSGAVQSSGIFIGQNCIFLQSDVHILTKKDLVKQDGDFLDLGPQSSAPTHKEGRLWYDDVLDTLNFYNSVSDVTVNLPEETIFKIFNNTGVTITNGQMLRVTGASGGLPTVVLAKADSVQNSRVAGMAIHDIEDSSIGYILLTGYARNLDTSAFSEGEGLFLSESVAGDFTNLEQQILAPVGRVLISDASVGVVGFFPQGVINITAIAQVGIDTGTPTQNINTTPEPVSGHSNVALPAINVNTTFVASEGNFEVSFSPASTGASGFYEFHFHAFCTYGDSKDVLFTLYINSTPTSITDIMPFSSIDPSKGDSVTLSGITPQVITDTDNIHIEVSSTESSGTLSYQSCLFNCKRIGNA